MDACRHTVMPLRDKPLWPTCPVGHHQAKLHTVTPSGVYTHTHTHDAHTLSLTVFIFALSTSSIALPFRPLCLPFSLLFPNTHIHTNPPLWACYSSVHSFLCHLALSYLSTLLPLVLPLLSLSPSLSHTHARTNICSLSVCLLHPHDPFQPVCLSFCFCLSWHMLTASLCLFQFDPEPERQTKRITKSMQEEFQHLSLTPPILENSVFFVLINLITPGDNGFCFYARRKMNVPDHLSLTWSSVEPKAWPPDCKEYMDVQEGFNWNMSLCCIMGNGGFSLVCVLT